MSHLVRSRAENLAKIVPASASQYIAMIPDGMVGELTEDVCVLAPSRGALKLYRQMKLGQLEYRELAK